MPLRHNRSFIGIAISISAGLMLSVVPGTGASAAADDFRVSEYRYTSEPGDYIGQGLSAVVSDPSQIAISGTADFVKAYVSGDGGWNLWFRAPQGHLLRPGVYRQAERADDPSGRAPGLAVFGNGRACNEVFGRFSVNQLRIDAAGNVIALDVRFVQRCEAADAPAMRGWFRYRVAPLSYAFTSDPGDFIGAGLRRRYEGATTLFHPYWQYGGGARVDVSGEGDDWTVVMMPPVGATLTEGVYGNALRFPDVDHPGLQVSGNGRGCNTATGSFEVLWIRFDGTGIVKRLHATFEQHCEGAEAALRGVIRFHA